MAVIPAYNEQGRVINITRRALLWVDKVIVVDDGSSDQTFNELKDANIDNVILLRHLANLGKGASLKTGCQAALKLGADIIVTLDGDGQHPPEHIPYLLDKLRKENLDIVFSVRRGGDKIPFIRKAGNSLLNWFARMFFNLKVQDLWCGMRAFKAGILSQIEWQENDYSGEVQMTLQVGKLGLAYGQYPIPAIYHDKFKGVMIIDGLKLLGKMVIWWLFKY